MIFRIQSAKFAHIFFHLKKCSSSFTPELHTRVSIKDYAIKLLQKSKMIECWSEELLVGLLCFYKNSRDRNIFITNLSVLPDYRRQGVAGNLLIQLFKEIEGEFDRVLLEVSSTDQAALCFYKKYGFFSNLHYCRSVAGSEFITLSRSMEVL